MFNSAAKNTKSTNTKSANTKPANALKSIAAAAGIAVLLGACSLQAPAAEDTAPERPVVTEGANDTEVVNSPVTVVVPKVETPTTKPPTTEAPKPAAPDYRVGVCTPDAMSDGLDYQVINIKDNDPDGGLVLRLAPSYNQQRITTIGEYSIVDSYGTADSCAVDSKGRTWWYVDAPGIASGWVNAYYLGFTTIEEDFHGDEDFYGETGFGVDNQHLDGELTDVQLFEDMEYDCLNGVTDCSEFYAIFGSGD